MPPAAAGSTAATSAALASCTCSQAGASATEPRIHVVPSTAKVATGVATRTGRRVLGGCPLSWASNQLTPTSG